MFRDALLDMNSHPQLEVTPDSVTPWLDYYDRNLVGDEELLATTGAALSPGVGRWVVGGGQWEEGWPDCDLCGAAWGFWWWRPSNTEHCI